MLFFQPVQDCAGFAAALEVCAKSILPSAYSLLSTQSLIHHGVLVLSISARNAPCKVCVASHSTKPSPSSLLALSLASR